MTEAKPTPGPWRVEQISTRCGGPRIVAVDQPLGIADLWTMGEGHEDPEAQANARLIASAPDLYAALKAALGFVVAAKIAGQSGKMANALPAPFALETEIRAALAKVRPC